MSSLQKALDVEQKKSSLQSALAKEMIQNGGRKRSATRRNPPTVTTAYESSSSDDDDSSSSSSSSDESEAMDERQTKSNEDMMKIRQEAIKLVNMPSAGPNAEASKRSPFVSPYQQQSSGARPPAVSSYQSSAPSLHRPQAHAPARTADRLSITDMVVGCVSDVCKSSSSELISKVLSSGYRSVNNYENPPVSGSWGEIDTSQHGYGNSNRTQGSRLNQTGNMPSRYQD